MQPTRKAASEETAKEQTEVVPRKTPRLQRTPYGLVPEQMTEPGSLLATMQAAELANCKLTTGALSAPTPDRL